MKRIEGITVTYYGVDDLAYETVLRLGRNEISINEITHKDLKLPKHINNESIAILKIGSCYKVLKSRY